MSETTPSSSSIWEAVASSVLSVHYGCYALRCPSSCTELNSLSQRQLGGEIDRIRLAAHVALPAITPALAAAAGIVFRHQKRRRSPRRWCRCSRSQSRSHFRRH